MAALLVLALTGPGLSALSHAESRRIEVYPLSQNYFDTQAGDTLSTIAARLLPNNMRLQQKLMADILRLNPEAFIDHNPDRLLAHTRLWLPNQLNNSDSNTDTGDYRVESFSWGNVKRPR